MSNRKNVCVLGPEDVELLKLNVEPVCCDHSHISRLDANQMTGRGDFKPYFTPIAEWVGPRHIRILRVHAFRGLATKCGEYHANAITQRKPWALTMLAQMKNKWESGTERESKV